jgi:hypothetical protein
MRRSIVLRLSLQSVIHDLGADLTGGKAPLCYVAVALLVNAALVLEQPRVQKMSLQALCTAAFTNNATAT